MRKQFSFILILGLIAVVGMGELTALDIKLERWVFGSGGMVGVKNSNNLTMYGLTGQVAIEKIEGTYLGKDFEVNQGFWVPLDATTPVDEPDTYLSGDLVNYPNPFNSSTTIRYTLDGTSNVTLKVYDVVGNLVKILYEGIQDGGQQNIVWDARDAAGYELSSGTYMYELTVHPMQNSGYTAMKPYNFRNIMVIVK